VGRPKAVGFIPPLIGSLYPVELVRFDIQNEEVIRGKDGFCIRCGPGEVGELLGKIDVTDPTRDFAVYTDPKATEKKILREVFIKGDKYFRTGDLLKSEGGFYYFVDRIGDTFRWKGENVSTSEVEASINTVPGVLEVNVYGVELPGHEGRCGMACIVVDHNLFNLEKLYKVVMEDLPSYAAPLFVRLREQMEITTTFKHKKTTLVEEGFNVNVVKDPLFARDDKQKKFVPLNKEMYQQIFSNVSAKL